MRNKITVLGIDPGLRVTGYGVIEITVDPDCQVKLLEAGTINPKEKDVLPERVNKIYRHLSDIIKQYSPRIMVLEKLYAHHRHPTTACLLGHVRGVICLVCSHQGIELEEYSVKRIRKSVVGNGSATKEQTRKSVEHLLKIPEGQLTLDASDALALALGYGFMQRF